MIALILSRIFFRFLVRLDHSESGVGFLICKSVNKNSQEKINPAVSNLLTTYLKKLCTIGVFAKNVYCIYIPTVEDYMCPFVLW